MKKILGLVLTLILCFTLVGCGNNNSNENKSNNNNNDVNDNSNNNNGGTGTITASITPANGWKKDASSPYPAYKKDGAKFTVYNRSYPNSYPSEIKTIEKYAEWILGTLKDNQAFKSATFSNVESTTVNGLKACGYTYTFYGMTDTTYYIMMDDGYVYSVGYSYEEGTFDTVKDDIQSMLDSYTIK